MANNINAFLETLLAAEEEYNKAPVGQTALLDCVYKDISTEAARVGENVQVYFPDLGPLKSYGNTAITADDVNPAYTNLVFNSRPGKGLLFTDFQQFQTAAQLAKKFLDPLRKRAVEYMNGQIANLLTPTNFNASVPIIGKVQGEVQVGDATAAWTRLTAAKCPMDADMLHLVVHHDVQGKMLNDSAWTRENVIGQRIAETARERGELSQAFRFRQTYDQQMPSTNSKVIYGVLGVTNGSTAVTGSSTAFTTDCPANTWLVFANDSTQTPYQVSSVASDVALTLASSYSGPTAALTTAKVVTQLAGTVTTTQGSATVTGSSTVFTTALTVGQWLVFSGDTTGTPYQVLAIGSNTSLTLATNTSFAGSGSQTVQVLSYTCVALHEYAVALALRPIASPPEAQNVVNVTYLDLKGIPVRIIISYQHIYQALFVTIDFGYALGVIRPQWGVLINC